MAKRFVVTLLLSLAPSCGIMVNFRLNVVADVVMSLQGSWRVNCVYLIHQPGEEKLTTTLRKHLSTNGIETASIPADKLEITYTTIQCSRNIPLYVVMSCEPSMKEILKNISIAKNLSRGKWILFTSANPISFFSTIYVPHDCEFLVAQLSDKEMITLYEIYRIHSTSELYVLPVMNWTSTSHLTWKDLNLHSRRQDLHGLVIKAAVINHTTIRVISQTKQGKPLDIGGYTADIWKILEKILNFKTSYYYSDDGSWGILLKNGSWNGMIAMVARGDVDVAVAGFSMLMNRHLVVDFLAPFLNDRHTVYIQDPRKQEWSWRQYIQILSSDVWMSVLGAQLLFNVILGFTYYISRHYKQRDSVKIHLTDSIFHIHAVFCQQGVDIEQRMWSSRLILYVTHLTSTILFASFTATLISHLTITDSELPFTDFKGFYEDGTYNFGVLNGSAQFDLIKESQDYTLGKIYKEMILPHPNNLATLESTGLQWVCRYNKFAYICSYLTFQLSSAELQCSVVPIPRAYIPVSLSIVIQKNSSLSRILNRKINEMRRGGLLKKIITSSLPLQKHPELERTLQPILFKHITPMLAILCFGILASLCVLMMECIFHRSRK